MAERMAERLFSGKLRQSPRSIAANTQLRSPESSLSRRASVEVAAQAANANAAAAIAIAITVLFMCESSCVQPVEGAAAHAGGEELAERGVFGGRGEVDFRLEAEGAADVPVREVFEGAAHGAARHDEIGDAARGKVDDNVADEALFAEAVGSAEYEHSLRRVGEEGAEIVRRAADGGGVELVGLAGHLCESRDVGFRREGGADTQVESGEIFVGGSGAAEVAGALAGGVARGAQTVFFRRAHAGEEIFAQAAEKLRRAAQVRRKRRDGDLREMGGHLRPLVRVVVHEYDGIDGEVEFAAGVGEVERFGAPVDASGGEVGVVERHIMPHELVGRVVFREQDEEDAVAAEFEEASLEVGEGFESVASVLAEYAVPEGIVCVDGEDFLGCGDGGEGGFIDDGAYAGDGIRGGGEGGEALVAEAGDFGGERFVVRGDVEDEVGLEAVEGASGVEELLAPGGEAGRRVDLPARLAEVRRQQFQGDVAGQGDARLSRRGAQGCVPSSGAEGCAEGAAAFAAAAAFFLFLNQKTIAPAAARSAMPTTGL